MKVIILDDKMCRVTDLDPEKVVDPVTTEDIETGEHTLSLGYPATGLCSGLDRDDMRSARAGAGNLE